MLVLNRMKNQEIVINHGKPNEVRVMVADIRGEKVRIGVEAPADMTVDRLEVAHRVATEGRTRQQAIDDLKRGAA